MVALVLGLLVAAAAVASLIVARQGFRSVDGGAQLRESARFAASLVERIVVQAGFENAAYGLITNPKEPGVRGYDNALVSAGTLPNGLASGTRTASNCGGFSDTSCMNGSDVLVLRYWGVSRGGSADGSMINCAGVAEPEGVGADPRAYSIFHVARSTSGEPALGCTYRDPATSAWTTVALVQGVEGFQVLYGTDGVTPNVCATDPGAPTAVGVDTIPERYLHASQLDSATGTYCANNWARVRSVRVGLLVRGGVGSAVVRAATTWNVLSAAGAAYSFADPTNDIGSQLTTAADGRLRQQMAFTIHLRNAQYSPQ